MNTLVTKVRDGLLYIDIPGLFMPVARQQQI